MKVFVKPASGRDIRILFPSSLVWNDVTAGLLSCFLKKEDVHLSAGQMRRLFRILRQYKRNHSEWILAEVDSADGSHVTVKL